MRIGYCDKKKKKRIPKSVESYGFHEINGMRMEV
jgi:hypothetical protein